MEKELEASESLAKMPRTRRTFIVFVALVLCLAIGSVATSCGGTSQNDSAKAAQESSQSASEPEQAEIISVSIVIDSSRAAEHGYPESMASTTVTLEKGASVYDALYATGVSIGGSSSYVESINGLSGLQFGSGSGWLYFVDGESPSVGYDSYILQGDESVTWVYTLDMGNDI